MVEHLWIAEEADGSVEKISRRNEVSVQGHDQFAIAALTTAASELSRNVWVHAKSGSARIVVLENGKTVGIELQFSDQGPGIVDLNRALAGGYSTANSLGLGLSGTKRLVDEFHIDTAPGRGTRIVIRKWKKDF